MTFKSHFPWLLVALFVPMLIACGPNKFKLSDRQLSRKMLSATSDHTGRINANGKISDGYDIAIVGDSLEWYDGQNQSGKRYTAESRKVDAVMIKHPHDGWPLMFTLGGGGGGILIGSYIEVISSDFASVSGKSHSFDIVTPLVAGAIGAGLGYLGGTFLDPGVQENAWILKINN